MCFFTLIDNSLVLPITPNLIQLPQLIPPSYMVVYSGSNSYFMVAGGRSSLLLVGGLFFACIYVCLLLFLNIPYINTVFPYLIISTPIIPVI